MSRYDDPPSSKKQEAVLRSPRIDNRDWLPEQSSQHRRPSVHPVEIREGFSPLLGSSNRRRSSSTPPPALPPKQLYRGSIGLARTGARRYPSLLQLLTLLISSLALYRTFSASSAVTPNLPTSLSALKALFSSSLLPSLSTSPPSPLHNPNGILGLSSILVGPRQLPPQYHAHPSACNSSELLRAVSRATILPDGASRKVDYAVPSDSPHSLAGENFQFSYSLVEQGCRAPHLYTKEEACDLLQAFGGIMLRGDSFVRHVMNALMILLSGRHDGAVWEWQSEDDRKRCRGNAMFDDRKAHCREVIVTDSSKMLNPVCGGSVPIFYDLQAWGAQPAHLPLTTYTAFRASLPSRSQSLSHIFLAGHGLHHHLSSLTGILGFVRPFLAASTQIFPKPVGVWMGIHAPAPGKPERWAEEQGEENVKRYNREVRGFLDALSPGEFVESEQRMRMVDWYNTTDGAESYDGSHYSYQVNMEKVLILLNLLDTIWGEAVAAGGLLETY